MAKVDNNRVNEVNASKPDATDQADTHIPSIKETPTQQSSSSFYAYVVTPYEVFYDGNCSMIILPTADGETGVMKGHAPIVTALYPGELRIQNEDFWSHAFISNGYAQVEREYVMVVCNSAEWAKDINPERAQEALERAQERYNDSSLNPSEHKRAAHAIRRAKNRLHVAAREKERLEN